jgi:CheY-like chemotaxis protein
MAKAVLLAGASPDDELELKLIMKTSGVKNPVMVVRDGREAIAYLLAKGKFADHRKHPRPEILFLNLKMPRAGGFAVLERLRDQPVLRNGLLVVVLTHFGDANEIRRAYALGADSFLVKPFTLADLENLIENFDGHWLRSDTGKRDASSV